MSVILPRRTFLAAGAAALATPFVARTALAQRAPARVGVIPIIGAAPIFVAEKEGWVKEAGLDLTFTTFESGPAMIQALASGTIDIYVAGVAPLGVARSRGVDVKVVASTATGENVFVAVPRLAAHFKEGVSHAQAFKAYKAATGKPARLATQPAGSVPNATLQYWLWEQIKADRWGRKPLAGPQTVAVIFDKSSTRTRVSFAVGIADLGGQPLIISTANSQLGGKESPSDTARVLERQVAAIVWRTYGQAGLVEMAAGTTVPVVNALSDEFHPCQLLADLLTIREHKGRLAGLTVTFLGDGADNMVHSYLLAGATAGMHVRVACPADYMPDERVVADADVIATAREAAERVLAEDPALLAHPGLADALRRRLGREERAALAKN